MEILFSSLDGKLGFIGQPGVRIASGAVYVVYSNLAGRRYRGELDPAGFTTTQERILDLHGSGEQTVVSGMARDRLELTYRLNQYPERPFVLLQLTVRNLGSEPIHLHELVLLDVAAGQLQIEPIDYGLVFFKVGWHGWAYSGLRRSGERDKNTLLGWLVNRQYSNPTTRRCYREGEFTSEGWAILSGERFALVVGLASMANQFGQIRASCQPGKLGFSLTVQADGILLDPGESFDSEWGYLQTLSLPDPDPAREYVMTVARQMGARPRFSPPPLQWTHWYQFFQDIDAQKFITNLDTITAVHDQIPFQVVQLDDGYQSAWGDWTTTNAKFPDGLECLAGHVSRAGFTPGLWIAPFVVQPDSRIDREHPDWLLVDRRGRPINAGFFYSFFGHTLDPTHPAVQEHLYKLVETLTRRWGFGMLKLDFCYAAALPGRRYDSQTTRAQALRRGLETIRRAAGEETFLLGCGCPFGPAIGLVDAMRIGPDTAPKWEPWFNWLPWGHSLLRQEPSPPSLRNSLRHQLNLNSLHRRWWWNDPDCLLVRGHDTGLTEDEVKSSVTLNGLSGGMEVNSDDLTSLELGRLGFLSLLSPILSPGGQPLDLLNAEMPELYHVPVQGAVGEWHLVALFNWQNYPVEKKLSMTRLGFSPGQRVYIFDFWACQGWQTGESELSIPEIPAHGCRLLRICALGNEAVIPTLLVGDTLHITQGLEIDRWDVSSDRLEIRVIDIGRRTSGALWITLPTSPRQVDCNNIPIAVVKLRDNVFQLPLSLQGATSIIVAF